MGEIHPRGDLIELKIQYETRPGLSQTKTQGRTRRTPASARDLQSKQFRYHFHAKYRQGPLYHAGQNPAWRDCLRLQGRRFPDFAACILFHPRSWGSRRRANFCDHEFGRYDRKREQTPLTANCRNKEILLTENPGDDAEAMHSRSGRRIFKCGRPGFSLRNI